MTMDLLDLDFYGLNRHPVRRNGDYTHKEQLYFYGTEEKQEQFRLRYRFRKDTVRVLSDLIREDIEPKSNTNNAFTCEQKVCIGLRYYATGSFQRVVGDTEGASQSSCHRIIKEVSKAFSQRADSLIMFSTDPTILEDVSDGFYAFRGKFPNCVGAIDGTQIPLKAPWEDPEVYFNRNKYFSLATSLIVNHRGAITFLSCRWPGSVHDSRVLQESAIQEVLDTKQLGKYYILGDSGYGCQYNLITPYPKIPHLGLTEEQKFFNKCHSKTRVKVECVIGQMKNKFPCLKNTSHYQPEVVADVVKACAFLWNFGLLSGDNKGYDPDKFVVQDKESLDRKLENDTASGVARREVIKEYLLAHR